MSNYTEILDKDGVTLGQLPVSSEGGRLRNIVYMTESGIYEKPGWLKFAIVKGVGGGGARGGIAATDAGTVGAVGPGAGGGYFEKKINAEDIGSTEAVTVGEAGAAGASGNTTGGTGGTTSFGAHCSATGGGGSTGATGAAASSAPGAKGAATGGDINLPGGISIYARAYCISNNSLQMPAPGGSSFFGNAPNFGGGANGAISTVSNAAKAGSAGGPGIVIIEEYE